MTKTIALHQWSWSYDKHRGTEERVQSQACHLLHSSTFVTWPTSMMKTNGFGWNVFFNSLKLSFKIPEIDFLFIYYYKWIWMNDNIHFHQKEKLFSSVSDRNFNLLILANTPNLFFLQQSPQTLICILIESHSKMRNSQALAFF